MDEKVKALRDLRACCCLLCACCGLPPLPPVPPCPSALPCLRLLLPACRPALACPCLCLPLRLPHLGAHKGHGVLAYRSGKVTVTPAEHKEVDRPQTVSARNGEHDWATQRGGEIKGLAEGIQVAAI